LLFDSYQGHWIFISFDFLALDLKHQVEFQKLNTIILFIQKPTIPEIQFCDVKSQIMSYVMISFHDVMTIRSIFVFLPCHYFLPFLLQPSSFLPGSLPQKKSIFEPNVKENTYSRLLYGHDIFRHFFSHWAQDVGKRVDPKYFWYLKALPFQDPSVTIKVCIF